MKVKERAGNNQTKKNRLKMRIRIRSLSAADGRPDDQTELLIELKLRAQKMKNLLKGNTEIFWENKLKN